MNTSIMLTEAEIQLCRDAAYSDRIHQRDSTLIPRCLNAAMQQILYKRGIPGAATNVTTTGNVCMLEYTIAASQTSSVNDEHLATLKGLRAQLATSLASVDTGLNAHFLGRSVRNLYKVSRDKLTKQVAALDAALEALNGSQTS